MQNRVVTAAEPAAPILSFCSRVMRTKHKACSCFDHPEHVTPPPQLSGGHLSRRDHALGLVTPKALAEQIEIPKILIHGWDLRKLNSQATKVVQWLKAPTTHEPACEARKKW